MVHHGIKKFPSVHDDLKIYMKIKSLRKREFVERKNSDFLEFQNSGFHFPALNKGNLLANRCFNTSRDKFYTSTEMKQTERIDVRTNYKTFKMSSKFRNIREFSLKGTG